MTFSQRPSLRQRLIACNAGREEKPERLDIPSTGQIDAATVAHVQALAIRAHAGDVAARDQLYFALRPRLDLISRVLRPWPNTSREIGIWGRDDVRQESWLVFTELLAVWDQSVSFIPYLLARFAWRLRDRILRGIGKSQTQFGSIRIPEHLLAELLQASDSEQPESVAIARKLLEELLNQQLAGTSSPGEFDAWLSLIHSSRETTLVSPINLLDDTTPVRKSNVA